MLIKPIKPAAITPISTKDLIIALSETNHNSVKKFESKIKEYVSAKYGFTFTSFMRSIYVCLETLKKISKKETVVLPRYSCPSFSHAIIAAGLKISYCDINPKTLSIDFKSIERLDKKDILAIIAVNFFGLSNKMDIFSEFCSKHDIYLIEDLGYSIGTEYKGKRLGSFGDFSVLNFQEGKAIPIGGGMVTTNRDDIYDSFADQKRTHSKPSLSTPVLYKFFSNPYFYSILINTSKFLDVNFRKRFSMEDTIRLTSQEFDFGFNMISAYNSISNFQGSFGCQLFKSMEKNLEIRLKNADIYKELLNEIDDVQLIHPEPQTNKIHYIRYPILIKNNQRKKILDDILKNGFEASSMYEEHGIDIDKSAFPGGHIIKENLLTLPCHPLIDQNDIQIIVNSIINC